MELTLMPFYTTLVACIAAQVLKPVFGYFLNGKWELQLIKSSGGFPSSHTTMVVTLTTTMIMVYGFSNPLSAISIVFASIIIYDALNVRWYSGRHIYQTNHLINELIERKIINDDSAYNIKLKTSLGHKYSEVIGGILLGLVSAFCSRIIWTKMLNDEFNQPFGAFVVISGLLIFLFILATYRYIIGRKYQK